MPADGLVARIEEESAAVGVALSRRRAEQLCRYLRLIEVWRARARLTAVTDAFLAARVHIADSLLCLRAGIPRSAALIDVGSGAGLPGIPLAIVRPDLKTLLLDADRRRTAFIELAARELGLPVQVLVRRAEDAAHERTLRGGFDTVVARAVAPLATLVELTLPFARPGGQVVLLKGPVAQRELDRSGGAVTQLGGGEPVVTPAALMGGEKRTIITIPKLHETPDGFPRRTAALRRRPLGIRDARVGYSSGCGFPEDGPTRYRMHI